MNLCQSLMTMAWSLLASLSMASLCHAQDATGDTPGITLGTYTVQQSVEFGYRASEINGNKNTYNTFINLESGVRLLDYSFDMRSLNHQGLLFDSLLSATLVMGAIRTTFRGCILTKTNGTTSISCSAAIKISGITICLPTR